MASQETTTKCLCPVETLTINRTNYKQYASSKPIRIATPQKTQDQELIAFNFQNNLKVNGKPVNSKIWPEMHQHAEEYKDYLKRLAKTEKDLFNLYFNEVNIENNAKIVEKFLADLRQTIYQSDYSPNDFCTRDESRKLLKMLPRLNMKYEETTNLIHYGRLQNMLQKYHDIVYVIKDTLYKDEKLLKSELRSIYRLCGRSTYCDNISLQAAKCAKPTPPGPIDRYTLRRV